MAAHRRGIDPGPQTILLRYVTLSLAIPPAFPPFQARDKAVILRAYDFFPPQRQVVPKGRCQRKASRRPNNRAIPWQQSYAYNHPLLFVIPSEAEESAVRHSGAPNLQVYNYFLFVILP